MVSLRTLCIACSAISGLLFGYDLCVISVALEFITDELSLSTLQEECVVSFVMIGAMVGCLTGGPLADRSGRKTAILTSAVFFLLGAVVMGVSPGLAGILCGRLLVGVGVGMSSITVPVYVAELAPAGLRGVLVSITEAALCAGCLLSVAVDEALSGVDDGWRLMLGLGALPAALQLAGMWYMPESPAWLQGQGRGAEASKVRRRMTAAAGAALPEEDDSDSSGSSRALGGLGAVWAHPAKRRQLLTSVATASAQNLCATNAMLYYSVPVMERAGYDPSAASNLTIASTKMVGILLALYLVRRVGRRTMLLAGTGSLAACHFAMSLAFLLGPSEPSEGYGTGAFLIIVLFVLAWNSSWAPLMWVVCSEVLPGEARATGMGLAIGAFFLFSYVVNQTFLTVLDGLGEGAGFFLYGVASLGCCHFVYRQIPEMRGLRLDEIERLFASKTPLAHVQLEEVSLQSSDL